MNVRINKDDKIKVRGSNDVYPIMQKILLRQNKIRRRKEYFWVIGLDTDNTIYFIELSAIGTLNTAVLIPREIYRIAVIKNVAQVIFCHNHPSGNLKPSQNDLALTEKLVKGGELLGVEVLDHLIIDEKSYLSMKKEKLM